MAEKTKVDLAEWIRKAGKSQRVVEFQYPYLPGLFISIAHASKFILQQIREIAKESFINPRTREQEDRFNDEKLRSEYCRHIINGWRGLTIATMKKIVPGLSVEGGSDDSTEIPFSHDVAMAIMEVSIEFENWVLASAMDTGNFTRVDEKKKEEFENL